jgi:hypothetical protein
MARKPHVSSKSEQELNKAQEKFDKFSEELKTLSTDSKKESLPTVETEQQTKLSKREANAADAPYIKPGKAIFSKEKFNEACRADYERRNKYTKVVVEHNEIPGEIVQFWKKEWPGTPAYEWHIPTNKPVYVPIYIAEHLAKRSYVRYVMEERPQNVDGASLTHSMVAKEVCHRIDCRAAEFGFSEFAANQ